MRKVIISLWALVILLLFAGMSVAGARGLESKAGIKVSKAGIKVKRVYNAQGSIVSIDTTAGTLEFAKKKGDTVTVSITEDTRIKLNGKKTTLDGLARGNKGNIKYIRMSDDSLKAVRVFVRTAVMQGTVGEVTENSVTLVGKKSTKVFLVDEDTEIYKEGVIALSADLIAGDHAKVSYIILEDGSYLAKKIKASSEI